MKYDFKFDEFSPDPFDGTHKKAMGGSELMLKGLKERINPDLLNKFQIIVSRVREIDPTKIPILWMTDTFDDEESQHLKKIESRKRFKKIVFVSNYQFETFHMAHGVEYNESIVLKNAIDPIEDHVKPTDKINIIYHTTPHRGLELLIPTFEYLAKQYSNLHLDVYSSFEIYGWKHRDQPYQRLFDICKTHPQITYHGTQPNFVIREALKKAHIFAFPSIWPETSCIAAIEAMSAGCAIVCPDFAALPETTMGNALMYRFDENPQEHINIFASYLKNTIDQIQTSHIQNHLKIQKKNTDLMYDWKFRAPQWEMLLESLANDVVS